MTPTSSNVLEPYNGSDPYIFVSYSHMDKNQVLPIIEFIQKQGLKVWYDKGLITGAKWRETIAERIEHCTVFLICLSPNCEFNEAGTPSMIRNELYLAIDEYHKDQIFPIMLEDFNLPGGIKMALVPYQKLLKYKMTHDEFYERLNGEISRPIKNTNKDVLLDYRGQKLVKSEYDVIIEIENVTGAIPIVTEIKYNTFGILIQDKHVIGLGLHHIDLTSLPATIGFLKSLKILRIINNQLTSLPESVGNLQSLTVLDLRDNFLNSLPESIGNLQSLTVLDLFSNQIYFLPESIGNMQSLIKLNLALNLLTSLPLSIGTLKNLKELHANDNKISYLPDSIGNLQSLKELYLNDNPLPRIPESIGNLHSLIKLGLIHITPNLLPDSIANLHSLKELHLNKSYENEKSVKKLKSQGCKVITEFSALDDLEPRNRK